MPNHKFFMTRDGVRIAYAEHGRGVPIVYVRGWMSHLELLLDRPNFRAFIDALAEEHRVIRYDMRGNGLSDRSGMKIDLRHLVDELEDLVNHLELDEFILWGASFGGPVAMAFAARHPNRVAKLILDGTYARGKEVAKPIQRLMIIIAFRLFPEMAFFLLSNATNPASNKNSQATLEIGQKMVEPKTAASLYRLGLSVDVSKYLPEIESPTLVVHSNQSQSIPLRLGKDLADAIRNAEFRGIDSEGQNTWEGNLPELLASVSEFLDRELSISQEYRQQITGVSRDASAIEEEETRVDVTTESESPNLQSLEARGYRVTDVLGLGGMAVVNLAVQETLDRKVAIKLMQPELRLIPGFKDRFIREARIMAELNHPNIVSVYDVNESLEGIYIAMEYAAGGDLSTKIQKGMSADEVCQVIHAVCLALEFAHSRNYVHRDLKPENVLFTGDSRVVLSDFGIAKSLDLMATQLTRTGVAVGTPAYMAPEQFGDGEVDQRIDLYSLGILVHAMLTGSPPYKAKSVAGYMREHLSAPIPQLTDNRSEFQGLIDALLAKNPDDRVQTVALARELIPAR